MSFEILSCTEVRPAVITAGPVETVPQDGPFVPGFFDIDGYPAVYREAVAEILASPGASAQYLFDQLHLVNKRWAELPEEHQAEYNRASDWIGEQTRKAQQTFHELLPELVKALGNDHLMSDDGMLQDFQESVEFGKRSLIKQVQAVSDTLFRLHAAIHFLVGRDAGLEVYTPGGVACYWSEIKRCGRYNDPTAPDCEHPVAMVAGRAVAVDDLVRLAVRVDMLEYAIAMMN
jgi:hypothetical protein